MKLLKKVLLFVFVIVVFRFVSNILGMFLSDYTTMHNSSQFNTEMVVNECDGDCFENYNKSAFVLTTASESVKETEIIIHGYFHIHEALVHSNGNMYVSALSDNNDPCLLKCDLEGNVDAKIHLNSMPLRIYEYGDAVSILLKETDYAKMYSVDFKNSELTELLDYSKYSFEDMDNYDLADRTKTDDRIIAVQDSDGVINLFENAENVTLKLKGKMINISNDSITMYLPINISKYFDMGILFTYNIESGEKTFLRLIISQGLFNSSISPCGKYLVSLVAVEDEEPTLLIAELESHQKIVYNAVKLDFPNSINLKSITK